jgi:hypothetical protein
MSYLTADMGPGAIGNMAPTHGLATRPTIGSNDLRENIQAMAPRPHAIPSMHGCVGCLGSNGNGNGAANGNGGLGSFLKMLVLPAAIGAVLYVALKD